MRRAPSSSDYARDWALCSVVKTSCSALLIVDPTGWLRMSLWPALAGVLAIVRITAAAPQTSDPSHFILSVAYCLGAIEYVTKEMLPYFRPVTCPPDASPEIQLSCRALNESTQQNQAFLQSRMARFRSYLLSKQDEPQWSLGIPTAIKRGETEAQLLSELGQSCINSSDIQPCTEDVLRRAGPDAVAARDRMNRCERISAMLPF